MLDKHNWVLFSKYRNITLILKVEGVLFNSIRQESVSVNL